MIGRDLIQKLCDERWAVTELLEIVEYLCWEDAQLTDYFMIIITDGLKKAKTVEGLGGFLTIVEGLLMLSDSMQPARCKNIVSLFMSLMDRSLKTRTKNVAASEVTKYQILLVNAAKNSLPSNPLRKLVQAREREIQDMRQDLGLKLLVFDF